MASADLLSERELDAQIDEERERVGDLAAGIWRKPKNKDKKYMRFRRSKKHDPSRYKNVKDLPMSLL